MDDARVPATSARRLTTSDIREANAGTVYRLLRRNGALTRAELVRGSGLTRPTVMAIVRDLLADGLIVETGEVRAPAGTGRPGSLLRFRADARVVAAVRVRDRYLDAALVDLSGEVIASSERPQTPSTASRTPSTASLAPSTASRTPPASSRTTSTASRKPSAASRTASTASRRPSTASWTSFLDAVVGQVLDLHAAAPGVGPLVAVAVSLPGAIDRASGLWSLPRRSGWRDVPAGEFLGQALGVPVALVNVVAAALLGQVAARPEHVGSAALVYVGRGVGSAAVVDGRLIEGHTGSAGELGHCAVPGLTAKCPCGRVGCVEAVTAAPFLRREFRRVTGRSAPATLAEMERVGDPGVAALLDAAAGRLGLAASWLVNILNPEVLYLGGSPFMAHAAGFHEAFAAAVSRGAHRPNVRALRVLPAGDTALAGTAQVAFELLPDALRPQLRLVR